MKHLLASLGIVCLLGGCGSSSASNDGGGTGGNGAGGEMSATAQDQSMPAIIDMGPLAGCKGLSSCIDGCSSFGCVNDCRNSATSQAQMLYLQLFDCERNVCYPKPDAGAAPCAGFGGTPSAECAACLKDVTSTPGMCGAGDPAGWCGACAQAYSACQADGP